MMMNELKNVIQALINEDRDAAEAQIKQYILDKTREITGLNEQKALDLSAIVADLKKDSSIEAVSMEKGSIHVSTKSGDHATFNEYDGKLYAWVQGQKTDIDCGEIGSTSKDVLGFLSGINKAWYKEHDKHFDE